MPDYRKKRRNRFVSSPKKSTVRKTSKNNANDIKMTSEKSKKTQKNAVNMKVVNGGKAERRRRVKAGLSFIACIAIVVFVFELILPAGIFKTVSNSLAVMGNGNYPVYLESSDTIDVQSLGSYYYLLSNTELSVFSNSGKKIYTYTHGFEKPILKSSRWGALLFDQGDNNILVFDLKKLKNTVTSKYAIINADISDSGEYALVTESDGYAGAVTVYSRYGKQLYEWYSAEDIISDVAIHSGRKRIAISAFKAENGEYKSKVSVLKFDSATPEFTVDYSGKLIYSLDSKTTSGITVTTDSGVDFLKWKKAEKKEYKNEYSTSIVRNTSHGTVAVFNRKSDPTNNKIAVLSKKGNLNFEFEFKGIISDIYLFGGHIYCMSDTDIYILDKDGKVLKSTSCGFGGVRMIVTGSNNIAVITDNKIEKIKLDKEG